MRSPRPWHWIALLAVIAAVLRAPYFHRDVIEWDESTFILMGQSLVDGHLPYTALWDNKPPLCFVPFALVIAVFGKSIVAIRVLGVVLMTAIAALVHAIAGGRLQGFLAGLLSIVFVSYAPGGMAVMSELIALVPLLGALVLLLRVERSTGVLLGIGACLACAMLVRTNLGVVAVAGLVLVLRESRRYALAVACGFAAVWALCALPYALTGELALFWQSVVVASAAYALHGVARKMSGAFLPLLRTHHPVVVFALATLASIVVTGFGASHYWIQIHPFTALAAAALVMRFRYAIALIVLGVASAEARQVEGSAVRIAEHIAAHNPERKPVLLFANHLAYWFLDMQPLSKVMAHPTNLFRPAALHAALGPDATPLSETRAVLAQEPLYIVRRAQIRFAPPDVLAEIDATLKHYTLETQIEGSYVYRRTSD